MSLAAGRVARSSYLTAIVDAETSAIASAERAKGLQCGSVPQKGPIRRVAGNLALSSHLTVIVDALTEAVASAERTKIMQCSSVS